MAKANRPRPRTPLVRASVPSVSIVFSEARFAQLCALAKAQGLNRAEWCRGIILRELMLEDHKSHEL